VDIAVGSSMVDHEVLASKGPNVAKEAASVVPDLKETTFCN
jgi:hypothetical protein